ncbi:phage tail tube protein [Sphingobium aquiterrae]|uniref:phage tail tube protein n=1 Tax=Sphingobium aquiterrae TaxID=2038656 RepID=UPI0030167C3D
MVDAVKVVLAKKEATYGTDSAPGAANAVLTRNYSGKPVDVDRLDRNLDQRIYGALASVPSNERRPISYEVEMAGSGDAGTAPAWMELLEACGLAAATLTADTDAVQQFALPSATPSSLTQHDYVGDQRRKGVGYVGSFTVDFTAGAYPFFSFSWLGLVPAATPFDKSAPPVTDLSRWIEPVEVNDVNTEFLLDGFVPRVRSWRGDAGVTTAVRSLIGSRYVRRGNHAFTSTAVIEAPDIATKDYIQRLRVGSVVEWEMTHGLVAGNIIELATPKVQITDITESEEDDILMWTIAMTHTVEGGSPDLIITAR